jgi:hypothetical protein
MKKIILGMMVVLAFQPNNLVFASSEPNEAITEAGDILQFLLPITAGVATLFEPDWEGSKQFAYSFGSAALINTVSKGVIGKLRPNEANYYSYPSGHSMAAFSGAGFIMQRYGPIYGWPALTAAGFVGYSRIQSENHYADDVLAGASIGLMMNWVWVTPYEGRVKLEPTVIDNSAPGVKITILDRAPSGAAGPDSEETFKKDPRFFYIFDFGPVYNTRNEVRSPLSSEQFDLTEFNDYDDETAASRIFLGWMPAERHNLGFEMAPYEMRNKETLTGSQQIDFQGQTYDDTDGAIRYAYKLYEFRLRYMYDLVENDEAWVRIGGALSYIHNSLELSSETGKYSQNSTDTILPELSLSTGWWFTKKWALFADLNWGQMDNERAQDISAGAIWQISDHWNMAGGYRYYDRLIQSDDWYNHLTQHQPFLSFGYFF